MMKAVKWKGVYDVREKRERRGKELGFGTEFKGNDRNRNLPRSIFSERLLERYVAKDIQSLCRYLRKMKDVPKELKVLVEKGKVAPHKLTKIYWKRFF